MTRAEAQREAVVAWALGKVGTEWYRELIVIAPEWRRLAWCGEFTRRALIGAGLSPPPWRFGLGYVYNFPRTRAPGRGDVVYWHERQHHALYLGPDSTGMISTVDGNQIGDTVQMRRRAEKSVGAYFSIATLLEKYSPEAPPK